MECRRESYINVPAIGKKIFMVNVNETRGLHMHTPHGLLLKLLFKLALETEDQRALLK